MPRPGSGTLPGSRVALRRGLPAGYEADSEPAVRAALADIAEALDWGDAERGPFSRLLPPDARVLIKPNWVLHENRGPWGLEPLITNSLLIRATVEAALASGAGSVQVADAPIQGCNFDHLLDAASVREWATALAAREPRFLGVRDLRRTIRRETAGISETVQEVQELDRFTLFDLGSDSLLEPVTTPSPRFRVTQYDPAHLARTHAPGRHQFLVAKEVLEADLVINLPKLKTHKKAGVTCALKNLVGINGNKEYLPHHRVGGAGNGGDCYPGKDTVKRSLELAYDRFNAATRTLPRRVWRTIARVLKGVQHRRGDAIGVEGSWSGNDTVWRMCLDLNRILLYGRADGTFSDLPERRAVHLVDGLIAGQGDGPLRSRPLPLGMLFGGESAAAVDWVAALLLGYDPDRIPIVRHAFDEFRWALVDFSSSEVAVVDAGTGESLSAAALQTLVPQGIIYPVGWLDAVAPQPALS
jgi:uncharacterized protein (DUF362 family)